MKMRKKTGIDFLSEDFMASSSSDTKANKQVSWCYEFELKMNDAELRY